MLWVFQSHAGSIEASVRWEQQRVGAEFQSHAGSIEAGRGPSRSRTEPLFQSHAGSIEAYSFAKIALCYCLVSIPRWFD